MSHSTQPNSKLVKVLHKESYYLLQSDLKTEFPQKLLILIYKSIFDLAFAFHQCWALHVDKRFPSLPGPEKMQNLPRIWSQMLSNMLIFYKFSDFFGKKKIEISI